MGYASYGEFALGFYNEVVVHLPFVSSVHNIWRAKQLFDLNFGFSNFRTRDSAKVEKILVAAGKGSYSESMYEAGPQSVTQVPHSSCSLNLNLFHPGLHSPEHRQDQQHPDLLVGNIAVITFLGRLQVLPDHENR